MSLPKNLRYQNKVESAYAQSYTSHIQPQNGLNGYTSGQTILINIPTANNLVLVSSETMLKFTLQVEVGGTQCNYIRLDKAGANGVIQRQKTTHGGNTIEDLENYGNLYSNLTVLQKSSSCNSKESVLSGFCNYHFCDVQHATTTAAKTNVVTPVICGERLTTLGGANEFVIHAADSKTEPRTYCISLLSILGTLGDKYIPLFEMTQGGSLNLELQLVSSAQKFICSHTGLRNFELSNVELIAQFLTLGDDAMTIIRNSMQGQPLTYVIPQWKNFPGSIPLAGAGATIVLNTPAKYHSLKSLFLTLRDHADGVATFFPHASNHHDLRDYVLRLGSKTIPARAPNSLPQFYAELLKSIGSITDINHEPMIDITNYGQDAVGVANLENTVYVHKTSSSSSFMIGIDLETYNNSDKESIYTGTNTVNDDIFFNLTFNEPITENIKTDAYALFDAVLIIENGIARVQF